jgi:hypothetical protein
MKRLKIASLHMPYKDGTLHLNVFNYSQKIGCLDCHIMENNYYHSNQRRYKIYGQRDPLFRNGMFNPR